MANEISANCALQNQDGKIVEYRFKPNTGGWICPNCGGMGRMADGWCSIGTDTKTGEVVVKSKLGTTCYFCKGKGRVLISALPD